MATDFDYNNFQLAVKIYQYAERLVMFPNDQSNIDYCKDQCKLALQTCRDQSLNWLPVSKTYKGTRKNMTGKVAVTVEVPWGLNSYGFSHYPKQAESIMGILHNMWTAYIHGEEIETIVSMEKVS